MTSALIGLAVLITAGWLPAMVMTGLSVTTLFLSIVVSSAVASTAAVLTVGVTGTPLPWFLLIAVLVNCWAAVALRRRRVQRPVWTSGAPALLGVLAGLVAALSPRVGYDAHAIWLVHSRLLVAGHVNYVRSFDLDAFRFANPDYPPAASSTVAVVWQLTEVSTRSGQLLIAAITAAAVGLLTCGVTSLTVCTPRLLRAAVGIALPMAAFGLAGGTGTVGYVDLLWSAAVVAAAVWGLLAVRSAANARIALVAVVVGGSTKQEGLVLAAVVVALIALRYRHSWRGVGAPLVVASVALLSWPVVVRLRGGGSELAERSQAGELLRGDAEVWSRFSPAASDIRSEVGLLILVAAACALAGLIAVRGERHAEGLGSAGWLWVLTAIHSVALLTAYAVSGYDLTYHLDHSVSRTAVVLNLLVLVDITVWLLLAGGQIASWRLLQNATSVSRRLTPHRASAESTAEDRQVDPARGIDGDRRVRARLG